MSARISGFPCFGRVLLVSEVKLVSLDVGPYFFSEDQ